MGIFDSHGCRRCGCIVGRTGLHDATPDKALPNVFVCGELRAEVLIDEKAWTASKDEDKFPEEKTRKHQSKAAATGVGVDTLNGNVIDTIVLIRSFCSMLLFCHTI